MHSTSSQYQSPLTLLLIVVMAACFFSSYYHELSVTLKTQLTTSLGESFRSDLISVYRIITGAPTLMQTLLNRLNCPPGPFQRLIQLRSIEFLKDWVERYSVDFNLEKTELLELMRSFKNNVLEKGDFDAVVMKVPP